MITPEFLPIILALSFGAIYFIVDEYHENIRLHSSFIAGSSIAYFFLVVLPEIGKNIPEYPLHLSAFEYFFVLLGFITVHISEKLILQRVEVISKHKTRDLLLKRELLSIVEDNLSISITDELKDNVQNDTGKYSALQELARTIVDLRNQEQQLQDEIKQLETKIQSKINADIDSLRWISSFFYHLLIGFILYSLMEGHFYVDGILYIIFALLMALVSIRYQRELIIPDLEITIEYHISSPRKFISAIGVLLGSTIAIILGFFLPLNIEVLYLMFSFVSGAILYPIMRDVIPENESGKPLYFLGGVAFFSIIIKNIPNIAS